MHHGAPVRTYRIALGGHPEGHKRQEGDSRTPEGIYVIDARNPESRFHLSLRISYPNAEDRRRAASRGVSPGGDIFIHGLPNGDGDASRAYAGRDWTDGCIAVTNAEIREIWAMVKEGTPIEIRP
jgi:murein L,D-transpeptidase YafK